ncbi:MAG: hypothetical protein R3C05_02950 [Pirellulaceae bacterium]
MQQMVESSIPIFIALSVILIYILELCAGFAVLGWPNQNALIDRRTTPGPYWFVMTVQAFLLIGFPAFIAFAG